MRDASGVSRLSRQKALHRKLPFEVPALWPPDDGTSSTACENDIAAGREPRVV